MTILMSLSECGSAGFLKILLFLSNLLDIIFVIVPIGLIIMVSIDFAKVVINSDSDSAKKVSDMAIKRILYASIVFAIPWIINVLMFILGDLGINSVSCLTSIDTDTVNSLAIGEEIEKKALAEARKIEIQEELSKNNMIFQQSELAYTYGQKGAGCDGAIYYEDGLYYKPSSALVPNNGVELTKGSGPSGYNKYFYDDLKRFTEAASKEGHTIVVAEDYVKGWRPYEQQQYFYCCYSSDYAKQVAPFKSSYTGYTCNAAGCNDGNTAAVPGTSNHGWGVASDLQFNGNYDAKLWAHTHANEYNLNFAVCNEFPDDCDEDWHIEPLSVTTNDEKVKQCL